MSTQAEPHMQLRQLAGLGPRQTWRQWCTSAECVRARNPELERCPSSGAPSEPWLTYWRDGLTAKQAMERVAGRRLR